MNQSETFDLLTSFSHAIVFVVVHFCPWYKFYLFYFFGAATYIHRLSNKTKSFWAYDVNLSIIESKENSENFLLCNLGHKKWLNSISYSLKKLLILLSPANAEISPRYLNFNHLFVIWWAGLTLVWFSPLFTRFSLCVHFTFLSLTVALGALFKILLFASVLIHRAKTSGLIKRITLLSCSLIIF